MKVLLEHICLLFDEYLVQVELKILEFVLFDLLKLFQHLGFL